jgi:hypothetical protein
MDEPEVRVFKPHPLRWVVEPLQDEPSYLEKAMFGCRGCYLHGRLVLVLASRGKEPWKGVLIPTEKKHHGVLLDELPDLGVHPMLEKWLYLPEEKEDFEETAARLVDLIRQEDSRVGVLPKPRRKRSARVGKR